MSIADCCSAAALRRRKEKLEFERGRKEEGAAAEEEEEKEAGSAIILESLSHLLEVVATADHTCRHLGDHKVHGGGGQSGGRTACLSALISPGGRISC